MIALFYLAVATYVGHRLCKRMLPGLDGSRSDSTSRPVASWVISYPAAFLCGTLLVTWATYLTAWLFRDKRAPLTYANAIVLGVVLFAIAAERFRSKRGGFNAAEAKTTVEESSPPRRWLDFVVVGTALTVGTALMLHTCRLEGDTLVLGRTAFGDLNIHLGMARSFSYGKNFPTGYVAYAGTDIRYHFMFYFLVGNLEYLGLPLDWAINLPSILSFASVLLLFHAIGSVAGRDARVGALAVLFFLLRSSPAIFFLFSAPEPAGFGGRISSVLKARRFIGLTGHEPWGIWNLNVYVVERHFAFAFGLVLLAVLYLIRTTRLDSGPSLFRRVNAGARIPVSSPN